MNLIERRLTTNPKVLPDPSQLGFGQHFSDHWFFSKYLKGKGWYESAIAPYGPIPLDPAASVLHYGQALFEGMKAFLQPNGRISLFRPDFNIRRMQEGAARLCLEAPPADLFLEGLESLINVESRWVPKAENCSLYIRPTLIGTEPFLGVRPSREVLFYIILSPVGSYYSKGNAPVRIWVEDEALRAAPGGLGATKAAANYAAGLQAAVAAKDKGYDQVLWLDVEREGIEEVGTMNVFFVLKDEVITPALNGSILSGCVRDSVIKILKQEGVKVSERRITINELIEHQQAGNLLEAFGTGTAAVISPIGEIAYKGKEYHIQKGEAGSTSRRLLKTITDIQRGLGPDIFGWMRPVQGK
jgi:branched-chain amino acid aminotransferase